MQNENLDKLQSAVELLAEICLNQEMNILSTPLNSSHEINGREYKSHLYFKLEKIEE